MMQGGTFMRHILGVDIGGTFTDFSLVCLTSALMGQASRIA